MHKAALAAALALAVACASAPSGRRGEVPVPPPRRTLIELDVALRSADPEARRAAAWELTGAVDVPSDLAALVNRMQFEDPDERVRLAAAWADGHRLWRIRAKRGPVGTGDDLYDTPPRIVLQTRPVYPVEAFTKKVEGVVEVALLIDEQGNVAYAEVRKSVPGLDGAALATVRGWKFEPARRQGRPVATMAFAPVTFHIY